MSSNLSTNIETSGSTSLSEVGSNYFLQPNGGPAVELSYNGAPVYDGEFGGWAPIAAEQTASGYEVALKVAGADTYTVWYTDANGNYLSNIGAVSGASATLESFETSFQQDLNGDGVIGVPGAPPPTQTVIETFGSTSLTEDGSHYFLRPNGGPAVELSYNGAPVYDGEFGGWAPIAAEQTASGYEVALKVAGADTYTVWYTDANGNYLSNIGAVSGASATLESFETSFQQDLNGDGVIGVPGAPPPTQTVIETFGSTSLTEDGSHYFLRPNGGPAVELSYNGAPVYDGEFGGWAPIAAEQTASGYEVALKVAGADTYTVWRTDANGNYLSNIGAVSGASATLESFETSFQQDLNGDGVIGVPGAPPPTQTVIETFGSTSLTEDGSHYFLRPNGGPAVELSYNGAPVYDGEFGGWAPIAAEQTASGYEVALKVAGADTYTVWYTDAN